MTAKAESTDYTEIFHSPNRHMALKAYRRFRKAKSLPKNENLALQAFAGFEWRVGYAVESITAEIFGCCLNRLRIRLPNQAHRPMQSYTRAVASINS